jgi:hypothetical protein
LGEYVSKDANSVSIKKPVQVVMMPNQDPSAAKGSVGMGFSPFLQYVKEWETGIPFMVVDMLTVVTPLRELENSYNSLYGSGIVLPQGIVT